MKKSLDKDLIVEIARETSVKEAFIEKDWYSSELLNLLSIHQDSQGFHLVFSGGTSLTKRYGHLKRFSEDLDFIVAPPPGKKASRAERREFREQVLSAISADRRFRINLNEIKKRDESRVFKVQIEYEKHFEYEFLRPHIQLEVTISDSELNFETYPIRSFISEFLNEEPSVFISCLSHIEILSDKMSALTWRVLVRDRAQDGDDPTMIRHLHDLAASKDLIKEEETVFIKMALQTLEKDQSTRRKGSLLKTFSIPEMLSKALKLIQEDSLYRTEYTQYVGNFSYADDVERISFETAIGFYAELVSYLIEKLENNSSRSG